MFVRYNIGPFIRAFLAGNFATYVVVSDDCVDDPCFIKIYDNITNFLRKFVLLSANLLRKLYMSAAALEK